MIPVHVRSCVTLLSLCVLLQTSAALLYARDVPKQAAHRRLNHLFFIENKGQWHPDVLYLCRMGGLDAWITKYGLNYTFYRVEEQQQGGGAGYTNPAPGRFADGPRQNSILHGHRVLWKLEDCNEEPQREGRMVLEGYYHYLIGDDSAKYARYVGRYAEILLKSIYNGIDLRYYFDSGYLRYDFIVHPGASPEQIRFRLTGQYSDVARGNRLVYTTRFGEVAMMDLHTHQGGRSIASRFVKVGTNYRIAVGDYDRNQPLIIDPLVYATYIGGSFSDLAYGLAIDASGNTYTTGLTESPNYDITPGAFQTIGYDDVFVTKLNADGSGLIYSTFIGGGPNEDRGWDIAVDNDGQAYVTGWTYSSNYDITTNAFQKTFGGGATDVFVTKLNADGSALVYSTYLGGSGDDYGWGIAIDGSGNAYVTGYTFSSNFDVTPGAFKTASEGAGDVFVTKLNADGSALVYSTYLGGSFNDFGYAVAVDASGQAYVTGATGSMDFDITNGAYQTSHNGGVSDVFVTKLNADGSGLIYSTYLGGSATDKGWAIAVDAGGHAYISGQTSSVNFDTTAAAYQTTKGGGDDVFVARLNADGTDLIYATYIGGSGNDYGYGISVDSSGHAYTIGQTFSANYDITSGAYQTTNEGNGDVFITKISPAGSMLVYSSYFGGSGSDYGYDIIVDASGFAYATGQSFSANYDVTANAYQVTNAGYNDVFVMKLDLSFATGNENSPEIPDMFWQISPNPNNGQFIIQSRKAGVFELLEVTGRMIQTYPVTGSHEVNQPLPAGVYLVRNKSNNSLRKVIVQ